jgi:hypothetical protein
VTHTLVDWQWGNEDDHGGAPRMPDGSVHIFFRCSMVTDPAMTGAWIIGYVDEIFGQRHTCHVCRQAFTIEVAVTLVDRA